MRREELKNRIPAFVLEVARRLLEAGHVVYLVGGAPRDLLLGREPADWDLATSARPWEVADLFAGRPLVTAGLRHGTVGVVQEGRTVEVTTFRVEGPYADFRRPDYVRFVDRLEEDLRRRDFTVNALALDPRTGELHDPCGGLPDLQAGVVRAVGEPEDRFREDALRLLRAFRLVAEYGWRLEPATARAIVSCSFLLERVAAERIWGEMERLLLAPWAAAALGEMSRLSLLERLLPGVSPAAVAAVGEAGPGLELRLAVLLLSSADPGAALERLRAPGRVAREVLFLLSHHLAEIPADWSDAQIRRWIARVGRERAEEALFLTRARVAARGRDLSAWEGFRRRVKEQLETPFPTRVEELAVSGEDVMEALDCGPGPQVGRALNWLLELALEDPRRNDPRTLRDLLAGFSGDA